MPIAKAAKSLLRNTAEKKPNIRHQKILAIAQKGEMFAIQQVIEEMPDVPRRTLERDLEILSKSKALKAVGSKKARVYGLGANVRMASRPKKKKSRK